MIRGFIFWTIVIIIAVIALGEAEAFEKGESSNAADIYAARIAVHQSVCEYEWHSTLGKDLYWDQMDKHETEIWYQKALSSFITEFAELSPADRQQSCLEVRNDVNAIFVRQFGVPVWV